MPYLVIIPIIIAIFFVFSFNQPRSDDKISFHITLADPKFYTNGIFTKSFDISKGDYQFSFVLNGDSPQVLSISLSGTTINYSKDFMLHGTVHETGISSYYTWDYNGAKDVKISKDQTINITINPHGNTNGSLSIDLKRI